MSGRKESAELARQYKRAGYRVEHARSGHRKIYDQHGRLVTTLALTPSSQRGVMIARRRQQQILAGELPGCAPRNASQDHAVADQAEADVPAAFRKADRRAREAELAAREADILGRAGTGALPGIRDLGDLFASVTTPAPVMSREAFRETFADVRRRKAQSKLDRRAARAWNSVEKEAASIRARLGRPLTRADLPDKSGTCITCMSPCDTVIAPAFPCAEGHLAFLAVIGLAEDQADAAFRGHWNEAHPMWQLEDGKVPADWQICGIPIPTLVCRECWSAYRKATGCDIELPAAPMMVSFEYGRDIDEDGPHGYDRKKKIAEAAMRVEQALVKARDTQEDMPVIMADIWLMESAGWERPEGLLTGQPE